jgi:hypothetical protein
MTEEKSVVQQVEEQSGEQSKLRAVGALRRTGVDDPEGIVEYLEQFDATRELAQNQEEFSARIKAIKGNLDLTDSERLEAGRQAALSAQERHQELTTELTRQTDKRLSKLNKTMFSGSDSLTLSALSDLSRDQLDTRLEVARVAGDAALMRAIRTVGAAKGFDSITLKGVALDPSDEIAAAYLEGQKLRSAGALEALSGAYAPPPVKPEELQPTDAEREHARSVKASEEASSGRILAGKPGITDTDYSGRTRRQVGRNRT